MPRIALALVLALAAMPALSQTKKAASKVRLTAERIMDRGAAALGSRAAWAAIQNSVVEGTMASQDGSMRGTFVLKYQRPGKFVIAHTMKGMGVIRQGYDGKTGWSHDPSQGLRKLEGAELAAVKRAAVMDSHLQWRKLYRKWELVGVRKVNGRDAFVIRLSPAVGRVTLEYHDTKTFRLVRTDMVTETAGGPVPIEVYPSDYRTVKGALIPFVVRQNMKTPEGRLVITMRIKSVKTNVAIPDSAFTMPKK